MLAEAHIDILNAAGQVEEQVRIVGAGEVGLTTVGRCEFQGIAPEQAEPPDLVIALRDGVVFIETKVSGTLRVDGKELGRADRLAVERELTAYITGTVEHRCLRIRTIWLATASLLSTAGAVIRTKPTPLEAWSMRAAARGARKVSEHLARLRAGGIIDEHGQLLVPLPADMNPDSSTDV